MLVMTRDEEFRDLVMVHRQQSRPEFPVETCHNLAGTGIGFEWASQDE